MPDFERATTSYAATVATAVDNIMVTPTAAFDGAAIRLSGPGLSATTIVSGATSAPITLALAANSVSIDVRSADNTASRIYTIAVSRNRAPSGTAGALQSAMVNTAFSYTVAAFSD